MSALRSLPCVRAARGWQRALLLCLKQHTHTNISQMKAWHSIKLGHILVCSEIKLGRPPLASIPCEPPALSKQVFAARPRLRSTLLYCTPQHFTERRNSVDAGMRVFSLTVRASCTLEACATNPRHLRNPGSPNCWVQID
jgi:hypothetical protein